LGNRSEAVKPQRPCPGGWLNVRPGPKDVNYSVDRNAKPIGKPTWG
jgi:hypothetical protein